MALPALSEQARSDWEAICSTLKKRHDFQSFIIKLTHTYSQLERFSALLEHQSTLHSVHSTVSTLSKRLYLERRILEDIYCAVCAF